METFQEKTVLRQEVLREVFNWLEEKLKKVTLLTLIWTCFLCDFYYKTYTEELLS